MYLCKCSREFTTKRGLSYHKKFCGKKKISIDHGYEYYIGDNGLPVYIHREVLEKKLGRKLKPGECAHHIDENKRNNDPDNIELSTISSHSKHHHPDGNIDNLKSQWGIKRLGSKNGLSKFTETEILEIRNRLKTEKVNDIAAEYNVHRTTIANIKHKNSWKHI